MMGRRSSPALLFLKLTLLFPLLFLASEASLYNTTDDLVLLDNNNFASLVYDNENAWLIEFYNSWCGHCIHFAPLWRKFGTDVRDWEHTVKIGVLDCSVDENMPLCREYEIMGYPTMRLFAARCSQGDVGVDMKQPSSVEGIEDALIDFLVEKQRAKNGSSTWVQLQPYLGSMEDLWTDVGSSVDHVVIIVDTPKSYRARGTILDLGGYSTVSVRYREATKKDAVASLPIVIIRDKAGRDETFNTAAKPTRQTLTNSIMKKLGLNRGMLPYKSLLTGVKKMGGVHREDQEGGGDGGLEEINSDILTYEDQLPDTAFTGSERQDQVFMVDVENAMSYALNHEVSQHKHITGEALTALQDFLDVLVRFLPARPAVHNFLSGLHKFTLNGGARIDGQIFQDTIQSLQTADSVLPEHQPWVGCLGSSDKYRGYPCGLWTTFHVLTVNAVLQDGSKKYYNPKKTLKAIHGFVKHFFGCRYCSEHFQAMYALDAESSVTVADDGILWLWRGHNKVNKRLKGDDSEDPEHPKHQFPSKTFCPTCWEEEEFNEREVLTYLKGLYAKRSLSFRGVQTIATTARPARNRQAKVMEDLASYRRDKKDVGNGHDVVSKRLTSSSTATWGFNTTDVSLCVFLYGLSTIIIMAVYCLVIIRRKMKRRKFLQAYKLPGTFHPFQQFAAPDVNPERGAMLTLAPLGGR